MELSPLYVLKRILELRPLLRREKSDRRSLRGTLVLRH
jgi:hypothetical protein